MSKRFISVILIIFILSSLVPSGVKAGNWVREVDGFFGGFDLKVNGKRIPYHRDPFIYDEEFYVSLDDLAKGLEMNIIKRGNSVFLDSNGKLKGIKDTSKELLVFQRSYEAQAKENIIEGLSDDIRALDGKGPSYIEYKLHGDMKKITIGFGNIDLYLDNKKVNLSSQPIQYKDSTYVNIDSIAPYLFITPNLSRDKKSVNIDSNGILLSKGINSSIDTTFAILQGRNYLLDLQRAELERKLYILDELKLPYGKIGDIKDLQDYLNKNFSKLGGLTANFNVVKQSNWINLDIRFPTKENFNWYKLTRSDVENWIWNIYSSILNLYDEEALISGSIRNPAYKDTSTSNLKNYVTFYSKDNDIYFDFTKSRLGIDPNINPGYLMEILNMRLNNYNGIDFSYEVSMSGSNLSILVYPNNRLFNGFSIYNQMAYLKRINNLTKTFYPALAVDGKIIYPDDKIAALNFYIEENRIRSRDLMDKTEDYLNINFNRFSYGNNDFILNYSLYESDLKNFRLIVNADFFIDDDKWINAGEVGKQRLDMNVHNAISYIFSLWDANLSIEVVDKSGLVISEFDLYQESVSIVSSNVPDGEILEGSRIFLSTDTPDTDIYYTMDGSTPTTSSELYTGLGILISRDTEIKAFGYKENLGSGPVSTFKYTVTKDKDLSQGLSNLRITPGTLNPRFSSDILNYKVEVDKDTFNIDIVPTAYNGSVKVNGQTIASGQTKTIGLRDGDNDIVIGVKESGKKEKYYTLVVTKDIGGLETTYSMEDLRFNTLFGLVFKGRITSNTVNDFSGYKVEFLVKTGKKLYETGLSPSGEFAFDNKNLDTFDKLFGFKYIVHDNKGNKILETNLN